MKTLEELRRRIHSVEEMETVVSTMKRLAAARIRQYETAANATKTYSHTIRLALQVLMRDKRLPLHGRESLASRVEKTGLILFGSDQGFCGRFNEPVSESAIRFATKHGGDGHKPQVLAIGMRVKQLMAAAGYEMRQSLRLPNSVAKITTMVQQIVLKIEQWQKEHEVRRIELFYNQRSSASSYAVRQIQLLPLSTDYLKQLGNQPWPSRSRPIYPILWEKLFSHVIQQHLFLQLFRACAESLASESASRIAAMQKAEANIQQRLEHLNTQFNQSRQRAITEEILDIICGFEAATQ